MAEQNKTIMAIGGHIGDMELTTGGYLATMALKGWKVIIVALTGGEKGNPPHMTVAEYREQKINEAKIFAEMLGGESIVFKYADGELPVDEEVKWDLADLIRKYKPAQLLTHWEKSIHKDHMATNTIVRDAQFYAGLPAFERELPAHFAAGPYYVENWEDPEDFRGEVYFEVTKEGFELWSRAIENHWFTVHSKDFKYRDYYSHLKALRGIEARKAYAEAYTVDYLSKRKIVAAPAD